ncbi:MAG: hypothetical protein LC114_26160, partial [Bryobacterales bacterium]|nr:hypothetical protein [Bryobacterales bacterium]
MNSLVELPDPDGNGAQDVVSELLALTRDEFRCGLDARQEGFQFLGPLLVLFQGSQRSAQGADELLVSNAGVGGYTPRRSFLPIGLYPRLPVRDFVRWRKSWSFHVWRQLTAVAVSRKRG